MTTPPLIPASELPEIIHPPLILSMMDKHGVSAQIARDLLNDHDIDPYGFDISREPEEMEIEDHDDE